MGWDGVYCFLSLDLSIYLFLCSPVSSHAATLGARVLQSSSSLMTDDRAATRHSQPGGRESTAGLDRVAPAMPAQFLIPGICPLTEPLALAGGGGGGAWFYELVCFILCDSITYRGLIRSHDRVPPPPP